MKNIQWLLMSCVVFFHSFHLVVFSISSAEFLSQLKQTHPFFKSEALSEPISTQRLIQAGSLYQWGGELSSHVSYSEPSALSAFTPEHSRQYHAKGSLTKLLWHTGGTVSVSGQSLAVDQQYRPSAMAASGVFGYDQYYESSLGITYRHPLLRNANGVQTKLPYQLAELDVSFSRYSSHDRLEGFLIQALQQYYDWVFLQEHSLILMDQFDILQQDLDLTRRKFRENLVTEVDVLRAEDSVRLVDQQKRMVLGQLKAKQAELGTLLQDPYFNQKKPDFDVYKPIDLPNTSDLLPLIKGRSHRLHLIDVQIDQVKLQLAAARHELKPDVALVTSYQVSALDQNNVPVSDFRYQSYSLGVEYVFSLKNTGLKARVIELEHRLSQLVNQRKQLIINQLARAKQLVIELTQLRDILSLNEAHIESAKKKTRVEKRLYSQGRNAYAFVIQARTNEQQASLTYLQHAILFHRLYVELLSLTNQFQL